MPFGSSIPANLSWATAKSILSQQEIEKLFCAYLNSTEAITFDADRAMRDFGGTSASSQSFKNAVGTIQNKIKKNMGNVETAGGDDAAAEPAKPKDKGGRKRKADAEDDGEAAAKHVPKKRGRPAKKSKAEVAAEEDGAEGTSEAVKAEGDDEDEIA